MGGAPGLDPGDRLAVLVAPLAADGVLHAGPGHQVALVAGVDEDGAGEDVAPVVRIEAIRAPSFSTRSSVESKTTSTLASSSISRKIASATWGSKWKPSEQSLTWGEPAP